MKAVEARPTRDKTFWKVLNAAVELDFRRGHLKWTMSELSRKSSITRSLIYYHFGRSKSAILTEAVRVVGDEVIGMSPERIELWRAGEWNKSIHRARQVAEQSPSLVNFYFAHRDRPTEIGDGLRDIERKFNEKLAKFFPTLNVAERKALYALMFGLTFFPLADNAAIDAGIVALKNLLRKIQN